MSRRLKPENQALQDRICAVLADAWPELLTSAQIAERVGGLRTIWLVCAATDPRLASVRNEHPDYVWCRAQRDDPRFPATHHDGPVPQDSWEIPWDAMAMNPPLNRLARDGLLEKVTVRALRGVLWRWAGDTEDTTVIDLESIWELS